ncbi:MAG: GIY-YIG nuclease family protein, partial [Pseudomonadales bacterium]
MTILLKQVWQIEKPEDYKAHFARWNSENQPLEVFVRDKQEWQSWQEYYPGRNDFNRNYIFALTQFYHEADSWLFGGIYRVHGIKGVKYKVELQESGTGLISRLKLFYPYRNRGTRVNFENHYDDLEVQEILREPYSGREFPGYEDIDLSFEELEALVRNDRPDWKSALANAKG